MASKQDRDPVRTRTARRHFELVRTTAEQSLAVQRTVVDWWARVVESMFSPRVPFRESGSTLAWPVDAWDETFQDVFVHLDDAFTDRGVDLVRLQMIWLNAVDDGVREVIHRREFGAFVSEALEMYLGWISRASDQWRRLADALALPTDEDLERLGERLLALEARQKRVEDKLDRVLARMDLEVGARPASLR